MTHLHQLSKAQNYNRWLFHLIQEYLDGKILEIGCGIGNISKFFLDAGHDIDFTDMNVHNIMYMQKYLKAHVMMDDISNTYINDKYKTIICINVLHHIENDRQAVINIYNLLEEGGIAFFLEPANESVSGKIEKEEGCLRRYSLREFENLITHDSVNIIKSHYLNFPGLLGWFINSKILNNNSLDITLYDKLVPFIESFETIIKPMNGLSVVCVVEKR